jgi:hypothetical protein
MDLLSIELLRSMNTDKEAPVNGDLLIKTNDGKLYYAPAGTLRPVDDNAPGVAGVHQFMDANAGRAIGLRAALCYIPNITAAPGVDGWMTIAAKASRDPGTD